MRNSSVRPAVFVFRKIKAAHKALRGQLKGGFTTEIQIAQKLLPEALEIIPVMERVRSPKLRMGWGGVFTALKWMASHPGMEPSCARIWPEIFGGSQNASGKMEPGVGVVSSFEKTLEAAV